MGANFGGGVLQAAERDVFRLGVSGAVDDDKSPQKQYTEVEMNGGLKEKDLPDTFAKPDFCVLLAVEKYQAETFAKPPDVDAVQGVAAQ